MIIYVVSAFKEFENKQRDFNIGHWLPGVLQGVADKQNW